MRTDGNSYADLSTLMLFAEDIFILHQKQDNSEEAELVYYLMAIYYQ